MGYNSANFNVTLGVIPISGTGDGEYFTAAMDTDQVTTEGGSDGWAEFVENPDKRGTCTLILMATNPVNQLLSALHLTGEVFPLLGRYNGGLDAVAAAKCRFSRIPDMAKAKETSGRVTWTIKALNLNINHGGIPEE